MATATEPIELVKSRIDQVDPRARSEEIERGDAVLIDVREPHEWDDGPSRRAPSSSRPPRSRSASPELVPDRSKRVLLYCRVGNRSARAADTAAERARVRERRLGRRRHRGLATRTGLPVVEAEGLTPEQRMRYSRHTLLPEVGVEGQLKLLDSKVLLIGAGGLGAPSAFYLAAAGVGTLGIVDDDVVDESQPPAPGDPQHRAGRDAEDRVGAALDRGAQPRRRGRRAQTAPRRGQHPRDHRRTTTSSSTGPTTSRPGTC